MELERLQEAFSEVHKDYATQSSRMRQKAIESHNNKTGVRPINFSTGDFVLKGVIGRMSGSKTALKWHGPFRVVNCRDNYVFEVENLLTQKKELVHGRRLKFFRNSDFEVSEEVKQHLEYQQNELMVIEEMVDIRTQNKVVEILVKWQGFHEDESDWVSFESLSEDVPELLTEFIEDLKKSGTTRQKSIAKNLN